MLNQDNNLSTRTSDQAWLLVHQHNWVPCTYKNTLVTSQRFRGAFQARLPFTQATRRVWLQKVPGLSLLKDLRSNTFSP